MDFIKLKMKKNTIFIIIMLALCLAVAAYSAYSVSSSYDRMILAIDKASNDAYVQGLVDGMNFKNINDTSKINYRYKLVLVGDSILKPIKKK